ncbi:hypothetical protein [Terriglobus sp.]|uniref:hypothetical protein n=1 Tax=Terriglobus sp. TaxID=1889013 RepID=UPI003B009149
MVSLSLPRLLAAEVETRFHHPSGLAAEVTTYDPSAFFVRDAIGGQTTHYHVRDGAGR